MFLIKSDLIIVVFVDTGSNSKLTMFFLEKIK